MKDIKNTAVLFCILFSSTTIISSIIQILAGKSEDTNFHIIDRAILVLIGVIVFTLMNKLDFKIKLLNYILPYAAAIILAMLETWISGFFIELHIHAYRDVFLNFTAVYIIFAAVLAVFKHFRKRRSQTGG